METISIYIHIPFCIKKCYYCDFISFDNCENLFGCYVDSLVEEIKHVGKQMEQYMVKTIFIGGGTPSILSPKLIEKIVSALGCYFFICNDAEFTIESNPGTLSFEILSCYNQLGINRLSIGLQATQDYLLTKLGRIHNFEQFVDNYLMAQKIGIENINVDLMFSLPNQTEKDWENSLDLILALNPTHISAYSLSIEQNTPFFIRQQENNIILPSDEEDRQMYLLTRQKLKSAGYIHYEISNFARENSECKHNLVYWNCLEYIGIGLGAHSLFNGTRYNNTSDLYRYIENKGCHVRENKILLTDRDKYSEFMFMGLRLIDGISKNDFFYRFNIKISDVYGRELEKLMSLNLIQELSDKYFLTDLGLDLSNIVFMEFI